jgi:tRNA A37 threonylcarbamoyladenosine biosynthesis protein TsaE
MSFPDKAHTTPIYAKTAPLVTQYFVIREKIWERMTTALLKTEQNKRIVLVMHGPGGSGKTQMVSYFVQQFRHK